MIVWRIASTTPLYRADDISGAGAATTGGRWNQKGLPMVYCSAHLSLAYLETLVHLNLADPIPYSRFIVEVTIPDGIWRYRLVGQKSRDWPKGWNAQPASNDSVDYGTAWLRSAAGVALVVPSVVLRQESNILLNPAHPDFSRVKAAIAERMMYDPRLFGAKPKLTNGDWFLPHLPDARQ
ncbi:MAG: RES domain-containing protein [Betaproteobacteria bacterium]